MHPELWSLDRVAALDRSHTRLWAAASVRDRARARFQFDLWSPRDPAPPEMTHLVVIGGGSLIDEAKGLIHDAHPDVRLVVIPSIWGSGAEASPVVVRNTPAGKDIRMGEEYLPHARAVWSELAGTISDERAKEACGDAWAHALEGFLSPLASAELRATMAPLIRSMAVVEAGRDPRWFELSAQAAAAQARSSVGLIHGIAHTLEPVLADPAWGHARLCATFLLPVFRFDLRASTAVTALQSHQIEARDIEAAIRPLFDRERYERVLPLLSEHWKSVLRDRSTRTNCTLVRPDDLAYFLRYT